MLSVRLHGSEALGQTSSYSVCLACQMQKTESEYLLGRQKHAHEKHRAGLVMSAGAADCSGGCASAPLCVDFLRAGTLTCPLGQVLSKCQERGTEVGRKGMEMHWVMSQQKGLNCLHQRTKHTAVGVWDPGLICTAS